jgi:hypothetical protein
MSFCQELTITQNGQLTMKMYILMKMEVNFDERFDKKNYLFEFKITG